MLVSQVSEQNLKDIDLMLRQINKSVAVFTTQMNPCYANSRKPLGDLSNTIVLCVSAIGSANAFAKGMEKVLFLTYISWHYYTQICM